MSSQEVIMLEFLILLAITLASGCGVTFGTLGIVAWFERYHGFRLGR